MSVARWWGPAAALKLAGSWRDCINLESPQGQAVLEDLARLCFAGRTTLPIEPGKPIDPIEMAFNEGKRSVFLHVCEALGVNVAAFMVAKYQEESE